MIGIPGAPPEGAREANGGEKQVVMQRTKIGTYAGEELHRFAAGVFEAAGMPNSDANLMAEHLVWADLHGVAWLSMRKIPQYLARLRAGGTPPKSEIQTIMDKGSLVVFDGRNAWGQIVGRRLMDRVIAGARQSGVCVGDVSILRSLAHRQCRYGERLSPAGSKWRASGYLLVDRCPACGADPRDIEIGAI